MSVEKEIRNTLSEASANMKKLDQLVRQGLMSPAQLPMLHRGLDKMQAGKVLNPQERDAVNKVMQSMLFIVTGDDTVFQKAKQHTQRNRYQTEEVEQLDEYGNYQVNVKGSGGTTVKARSDKEASQKAFKNMGIADRHRKTVSHSVTKMKEDEEYDNEGGMAKKQLTTLADAAQELMGMLSDNQNLPEWVQSKITKATDYLDTARDYMKSEGDDGKAPVGEEADPDTVRMMKANPQMQKQGGPGGMKGLNKKAQKDIKKAIKKSTMSESYKEKFAAALKKSGKTLAQMSDEEKKKFFNDVDASHKAKNEEVKTTGPGVKMMPPVKGVAGKTQKVGGKLSHPPRKPNRLKPDPMFAKNEETVDEGAMKRMATQQQTGEKGSGLETYKKKPAAKDTMVASPKTQRVKMTTAKAAKRMVAKGAVYAEDAVSDSEEMRAKTERKLKRMSSMKANQEKKTDPGIKEDARSDARRAMRSDSKGMAPLKKPGATKTHTGTKAGDEKHGGHIVMQLRKAVSISKPVKFKDGTTKPISKAHAHKFLSKYNAGKPAEKEAMHGAHDSHDAFMKHINK